MKIGYFLKLLMDFGIKQSEIAEKNEMTQNDLDNEWFNNWIDEGDNDLYYKRMVMNCINTGRHAPYGSREFIKQEIIRNKKLYDQQN